MRLLRGLGSQLLPCGCLAGVYETYAGTTISIVDARGGECVNREHHIGRTVPIQRSRALAHQDAAGDEGWEHAGDRES